MLATPAIAAGEVITWLVDSRASGKFVLSDLIPDLRVLALDYCMWTSASRVRLELPDFTS